MKKTKAMMRLWLASVSLGGFLGGWALLAQAPKPASASNDSAIVQQPLPTLAPLPAIGSDAGTASLGASLPSFRSRAFMPVFRTGGS